MTTLETLLTDPDAAGVWNLVPDRSIVGFKIRNFWGLLSVRGEFTNLSGSGQISLAGAVSGSLDIRVGSLRTGIGRRDRHLRSVDFFDVGHFPEMGVAVTALRPTAGKKADLQADLTIKGITAPLPLSVTVAELDDGAIRISGTAKVDRIQFAVAWNKVGMISKIATASAELIFVRPTR